MEPYERIGGDLTIGRMDEDSVSMKRPQRESKQMQVDGKISGYSMMAYSTLLSFHKPDTGELIFPSIGMGVDSCYIPIGRQFTHSRAQRAVSYRPDQQPRGDVVITRDLALNYKAKVGDAGSSFLTCRWENRWPEISGQSYSDTPNHQGSKVSLISHTSASLLTGSDRPINTVLVTQP